MSGLPASLTRREFVALVGSGAAVLVLGEGLWAAEAAQSVSAGSGAAQSAFAVSGFGPLASGANSADDAGVRGDSEGMPGEDGEMAASDEPNGANDESGEAEEPAVSDAPRTLDDLPWNLRLVNDAHPLPDDFAAPELCEAPQKDYSIDVRVYDDLAAMLAAAEDAGVHPVICSAYRTAEYQQELFRDRVQRVKKEEGLSGARAEDAAAFWVARPGASEHQAGFAVDLVDEDYQQLDEKQETTDTQRWLIDHCAEYGFILRYPTDKSAATGIGYEPWHYRHVGRRAARAITDSGLCFEEWVDRYLAGDLDIEGMAC